MTAWFVMAVIVKIAASAALFFGARFLIAFWTMACLERENLLLTSPPPTNQKAKEAMLFIQITQAIVWGGAALIALAIWWQA